MPAFKTSRHVAVLVFGALAVLAIGLTTDPKFVGPSVRKSNPATAARPASNDLVAETTQSRGSVGLNPRYPASPDFRGEKAISKVEPESQAPADTDEEPAGRQRFDWYGRGLTDAELAKREAECEERADKLLAEAHQLSEVGQWVQSWEKIEESSRARMGSAAQYLCPDPESGAKLRKSVEEGMELLRAGRNEEFAATTREIEELFPDAVESASEPGEFASSSEELARARKLVRLTQRALERASAEDTHAKEALARAEAGAQTAAQDEAEAERREWGSDKPLAAIVVEGNLTIPTEDIKKLIGSRLGQPVDSKQIRKDVRELMSKHWFFTVEPRINASEQGPVLVFRVREQPLMEKVTYRGNKHFSDEELTGLTWLKPGTGYDVGMNRESVRRIEEHYKEQGYAHAKATLEKGDSLDDREVIIQIDEGPRVVVTKVGFTGNILIPGWELWLHVKAGLRDGSFSASYLSLDDLPANVEALKTHYHNLGFFDVRITHRVEFSADRARAEIEYVIDEGQRYVIEAIRLEGNDSIPDDELWAGVKVAKGQFYDQRRVDADKARILAHCRQSGRLCAVVGSRVVTHEEPGACELVFGINAGDDYRNLLAADGRHGPEPLRHSAAPTPGPDAKGSEPPDLRDIDRLVLSGVETFDAADVRAALARNLDLLLAAHPDADLFKYLGALQSTVLAAYRHCGFPDATVNVALNHSTRQIELRVKEGQRYRCGALSVNGLPQELTERVVAALTEDPKPYRVLWRKGEPAAFDAGAEPLVNERVAEALAAAGYYPTFKIAVTRAEPGVATLAIEFPGGEGPHAVLGGVEIVGLRRDSETDVLKYLDIELGMPCDSRLPQRLEQRLLDSGRYLSADVDERGGRLRMVLREYNEAPPLTKELSPAEQALLKLRGWIDRWADGKTGDDLVATASAHILRRQLFGSWSAARDERDDGAEIQVELRSVLAAGRGQIVALAASGPGDKLLFDAVFGAYPDRLVLASPRRQATLMMPNPKGPKPVFTATGKAISRPDGYPFALNFGLGFNSGGSGLGTAFETRADFSAACMLSLAHLDGSQADVRDGVCEIRNRDSKLLIDAESGRLIEFKIWDQGNWLSLRPEKGAFDTESKRLDATLAASHIAYDPESRWKSTLEFFLDETIEALRQEGTPDGIETLGAVRKVVGNWRPPACSELFAWSDDATPRDRLFRIPAPRNSWPGGTIPTFPQTTTAFALPIYRRLVPRTGWMWPAGRDAMLYWASGDPRIGRRFQNAVQSRTAGPAGELLLANVGGLVGLWLGEQSAPDLFDLLSAAAFGRDYKPLLADDSWLGCWTVSLFAAIKTLDDEELRALVRLLPEAAPRDAIVETLLLLRASGERPVAQVLPTVFDGLWAAIVRATIEIALEGLSSSASPMPVEEPSGGTVQQAGYEEIR